MANLATYISAIKHIEPIINAGANELILEDPAFSIRSYSDEPIDLSFNRFAELATEANKRSNSTLISVNVDLLVHERHMGMLYTIISKLKELKIIKIRIQDPGLIPFFNENYPDAHIILGTETGNANAPSIIAYNQHSPVQQLSNELPHTVIHELQTLTKTTFDLQIHGPLLIQYSNRRFMAGNKTAPSDDLFNKPSIERDAQAKEYPGRFFPFLDNTHGHFMYLYFDRCLMKCIPELVALNLDTWIIDGRGESIEYLLTALSQYNQAQTDYLSSPEKWDPTDCFNRLKEVSKRPLRPGFFKINRTNYMPKRHAITPEGYLLIGTVLDAAKGHCTTVELSNTLRKNVDLIAITPNDKQINMTTNTLTTLDGQSLDMANSGDLVLLPWAKAMVPKTKIYSILNQ